jgi:hypothetical protein
MANFMFGFDSFKVENCRSKGDHNDSDWLTLTVSSGQTVFPGQTKQIGDNLHAGDQVQSIFLGPFTIDESKLTTATFAVANLRQQDDQGKKAAEIALQIGGGVLTVVGGLEAAAAGLSKVVNAQIEGAIIGAVGSVLGTIGGVIGITDSDPNCDGEVFKRVLMFLPGELKPGTRIGPVVETARSPSECGNDPHTTVVYSIISDASGLLKIAKHAKDFLPAVAVSLALACGG